MHVLKTDILAIYKNCSVLTERQRILRLFRNEHMGHVGFVTALLPQEIYTRYSDKKRKEAAVIVTSRRNMTSL